MNDENEITFITQDDAVSLGRHTKFTLAGHILQASKKLLDKEI